MEVADIIVVNKADGDTEAAAERSAHQHRMSIDLLPRRWASWAPQVLMSCALFACHPRAGAEADPLSPLASSPSATALPKLIPYP